MRAWHAAWCCATWPIWRRNTRRCDGDPWADPVTDYLERSLEADPDHLPATLALLERYRNADSPKDWHRATDLAAQRFPGNTADPAACGRCGGGPQRLQEGRGLRAAAVDAGPDQPAGAPAHDRAAARLRAQADAELVAPISRGRRCRRRRSGNARMLRARRCGSARRWSRCTAIRTPEAEGRLREAVQLAGGGTAGWFRAVLEAALMGWSEQQPSVDASRTGRRAGRRAKPGGDPVADRDARPEGNPGQQARDRIGAVADRTVAGGGQPHRLVDGGVPDHRGVAASIWLRSMRCVAYAREAMRRDPEDPPPASIALWRRSRATGIA